MKRFWIYGYGGQRTVVRARTARAAARFVDYAVMMVRDGRGAALTPDLWAT